MNKIQEKNYWTYIQMSDNSYFIKRSFWNGKKLTLTKDPNNHKDWLKKATIRLESSQTTRFRTSFILKKATPMVKR